MNIGYDRTASMWSGHEDDADGASQNVRVLQQQLLYQQTAHTVANEEERALADSHLFQILAQKLRTRFNVVEELAELEEFGLIVECE